MASFHNRLLFRAALVAASTVAFVACGESGPNGNTSLSIQLKDVPSELQKAVVTISEVDLVGSNGTIVPSSTPVTVDLLTLAAQTMDLVKDATVPSGTYTQLRFKISGAYIETGTPGVTTSIYATSPTYAGLPAGTQVTGDLQTPSFDQSGLKVTMQDNAQHAERWDEQFGTLASLYPGTIDLGLGRAPGSDQLELLDYLGPATGGCRRCPAQGSTYQRHRPPLQPVQVLRFE